MRRDFAGFVGRFPPLPSPDDMVSFWLSVFPPLSLLSNFVLNSEAYWRRIQRILSHIDDNSEVPCPFARPSEFVRVSGRIISRLDPTSLPKIVRCLERMPHASDVPVLLWDLPAAFGSGDLLLRFIDHICRDGHWLWTGLLNTPGGADVVADRLVPYVEPLPRATGGGVVVRSVSFIGSLVGLFLVKPPDSERFGNFFRRLMSLVEASLPITLAVNAFLAAHTLLDLSRHAFGAEAYHEYWSLFIETSVHHSALRRLLIRMVMSNSFCEYSRTTLARALLENSPDQEVIWTVGNFLFPSDGRTLEKPILVLELLAVGATTNVIFARTFAHVMPVMIRSFGAEIPWLTTFIRHATGFVIIAQSRHECSLEVAMIFDLFAKLTRMQLDWLSAGISSTAAVLLASQKVAIALVNSLKPSASYDLSDLRQWDSEAARTVCLSTLLLSVKEEVKTRLQKAVTRGAVPKAPSRITKVVTLTMNGSPGSEAATLGRKRGPSPTRPVLRSVRPRRAVHPVS
jgi:hypothetical protein